MFVFKPDTQETVKQYTVITLNRNPIKVPQYTKSVDNSANQERRYLDQQILSICHDRRSLAFYQKVVRLLPKPVVFEALSRVKEAQILGRIKDSPGAMFTDLIKRQAKELGIEFGNESRENEPQPEPIRESEERETPAEIMMAGRMGRL